MSMRHVLRGASEVTQRKPTELRAQHVPRFGKEVVIIYLAFPDF